VALEKKVRVVAPILVLLANLPPTVRDVLGEVLAYQADVRVVGDVSDQAEVLLAVGRTGADVVILGMHDAELPGIASHLLDQYPHLKILAISSERQQVFLYELRPQLVSIGEMDGHGVLHAIRTAMRSEAS
jgi:DNA-binding NarL/FixJ family response regulator